MERTCDTSHTMPEKIVRAMNKPLRREKISKIIDAGSGKTSASVLLNIFKESKVDAVIFPGDNRKKNPMENQIGSDRIEIVEADICSTTFRREYDLCLAYLTLGEAAKFNNSFENLFHHIMDINSRYYIIVDILEDPCVHYRYVEQWLKEKGFSILKKKKFRNPTPEHYPKIKWDKYKLEFESKHYVAYLIKASAVIPRQRSGLSKRAGV